MEPNLMRLPATRYTALALAAALAGMFLAGRCTTPRPAGPSRDSTALESIRDSLRLERLASAKRDSARARTVDSLLRVAATTRAQARQRLQERPTPVQPVGATPDTIAWQAARIATLEGETAGLRQLVADVIAVDSATIAGLAQQFRDQQAETARLRVLLTQAEDSLGRAAVVIGGLEAKVRNAGCRRVLGLPVPELGAGGAAIWDGTGFAAGVGVTAAIPLRCI